MMLKVITLFFMIEILGGLFVSAAPFQINIEGISVSFGRQLSGDRVGQHKVPPLSPVNMEITASVSSPVDNAVLIDYFPSNWTVIDANGGSVSVHDEQYNKIEWSVGDVVSTVSRSYTITAPQRTIPPTEYYFRSELTYSGGNAVSDDWMVIVADPTVSDTVNADFAQGIHENTENVGDAVRLIQGYRQGRFTSRVFDLENLSVLENLIWTRTAPTLFFQKSDNVGAEPTTLVDGSTRTGTVVDGSIADTRAANSIYENIRESTTGSQTSNSYTPTGFTLVDNTRLVSGTVENVTSDDNLYLTLRSFISGEDISSRSRAFIAYRSGTGVNGIKSPKVRSWDGYGWSAEVELPSAGENIRGMRVAINPVRKLSYENIVVTLSADLYLDAYVWNGSTWVENHNINSSPVRASYPAQVMRPFDIAYEMKSGRAMLVYDVNINDATKDLAYRIWDGSSWSSEYYIDISGVASTNPNFSFVKLVSFPDNTSDNIAMIVLDETNSDAFVAIWNGSSWGDFSTVTTSASTGIYEVVDIAYETNSKHILAVTGSSNKSFDWTEFTGAWSTPTTTSFIATGAVLARYLILKSNPASDNIMLTVIDTRPALTTMPWNGTAWGSYLAHDTAIDYSTTRCADFAWNPTGQSGLLIWGTTAGQINYNRFSAGAWGTASSVTMGANIHPWFVETGNPRNIPNDNMFLASVAEETVYKLGAVRSGLTGAPVVIGDNTFTNNTLSVTWQSSSLRYNRFGVPTEFTEKVEFTGKANAESWEYIDLTVNSQWTVDNVNVVVQLYNYGLGRYATIGENGYLSYTSGAANTDENKTLTVTANPENFRDADNNWKVMITGSKTTGTLFDLKVDLVQFTAGYGVKYALIWQHNIENVHTAYDNNNDNYTLKIKGMTSGDSENIGVYIWRSASNAWEFVENLTTTERTITKILENIDNYLVGNSVYIKYQDWDNTDKNQTTLHVDLVIVEENIFFTSEVKLQVRVSENNITWTDNLGPDGTSNTYFTTSPASLENIPQCRYFRYVVYFWSENEMLSGASGPKIENVQIQYVSALALWNQIEAWTGTVKTSVSWKLIETWTGTIRAPAVWRAIETWTGTLRTQAASKLIEMWTGTLRAPASWKLIETWTGTLRTTVSWRAIETWTGTLKAAAVWKTIETWSGLLKAPAQDRLIETWTGTIKTTTTWRLIETWTGTIKTSTSWRAIESWTGTLRATTTSKLIETWTGTVRATSTWRTIETWSGTVRTTTTWRAIETWTGTLKATATWRKIETWTGTLRALTTWKTIESWTGMIRAPAQWQLIETWSGTLRTTTSWRTIETWGGTLRAGASWKLIESWSGTLRAPASWKLVDTWSGTLRAPAMWRFVESWYGALRAPASWKMIDAWVGTLRAPASWKLVETWSGTLRATTAWKISETWTGILRAAATWKVIETWTGTVKATAQWKLVDIWTGTIRAPASWKLVETWTSTLFAQVPGKLFETWTGTLRATASWNSVESWNGYLRATAAWEYMESWTGTLRTTASWKLVDTWTGTVRAPYVWRVIETWTGSLRSPATWKVTESWTGTLKAAMVWKHVETWTGKLRAVGFPISSVNAISPYWENAVPFTITATASDPSSGGFVVILTLWYRYSENRASWSAWENFGDNAGPWSWSFTAPAGNGYYEFYSIAVDEEGNVESAPAVADASCGVDNVPPVITSVAINNNASVTSSTSVTISITAFDNTSGVTQMRFSEDNTNWTNWETFSTTRQYTLQPGSGTRTVYVGVRDNAGLASAVASASIELLVEEMKGTIVTIVSIPKGTSATANFAPHQFWVTGVTITANTDLSDVRVSGQEKTLEEVLGEGKIKILPPVGTVYPLFWDIETNLESSAITSVRIDFRIERSWVAQNEVDEQTIKLYRYANGWQQLHTVYAFADERYFHYEATSPGLSIFAAIGERKITRPIPPVMPSPVAPTQPLVPYEFFTMLAMAGGLATFTIIYSLTRPSRYYVVLKRLERVVAAPRRRRIGKPLAGPTVVRKRASLAELAALQRLRKIAKRRRKIAPRLKKSAGAKHEKSASKRQRASS